VKREGDSKTERERESEEIVGERLELPQRDLYNAKQFSAVAAGVA